MGESAAWRRVVVREEPAAGLVAPGGLPGHELVAVAGVPALPEGVVALEERL
jgi:hypothetical protein